MSGLCFILGFSSGFLCKILLEKKCHSNNRSNRIHQLQNEYTFREMTSRNSNLPVTQQPQQAIRYDGNINVPVAQARVIINS